MNNSIGNGYRPAGTARAPYSGSIGILIIIRNFCINSYITYRNISAICMLTITCAIATDGGTVATTRNAQDIFFHIVSRYGNGAAVSYIDACR